MFSVFKRKKEGKHKGARKLASNINFAGIELRAMRENEGRVVTRVGYDSFILFCRAIVYNDLDAVKRMIADGYNVNAPYGSQDGVYPLDVAARFGTLEAVELLLEAGASPFGVFKPGEDFSFAWTPWGNAIHEGRVGAFRTMLKHCDYLHMFNNVGATAAEECFRRHGNKTLTLFSRYSKPVSIRAITVRKPETTRSYKWLFFTAPTIKAFSKRCSNALKNTVSRLTRFRLTPRINRR